MVVFYFLLLLPLVMQHFTIRGHHIAYEKRNTRALAFFFFFLTILVMLRHESIGNDTRNYSNIFRKFGRLDWGQTWRESVEVVKEKDPAFKGAIEVLLYPSFKVMLHYRLAHKFYNRKMYFMARLISQRGARKTGIEIHPGATIGEGLFIDHGNGVIIGETTIIGNNVTLYQGVTLGALSTRGGQGLRGKQRHPTIEDNVTIYAGASILGGETVIGHDSVIGSNVFITESVEPGTSVRNKKLELQFKVREIGNRE